MYMLTLIIYFHFAVSIDIDIDDLVRTFNSEFLPPYRSEDNLPPSYETIVTEESQPPKYVDIFSPGTTLSLVQYIMYTSMPGCHSWQLITDSTNMTIYEFD